MCNLGKIDRIVRFVIAMGLFGAAALTPYWWLSLIGLVAVGTAFVKFCPLYALLGLNSGCKPSEPTEPSDS